MKRFILSKKKILVCFIYCCMHLTFSLQAQDNVGIGTNTPDLSAILEMLSTNKGVLIPRMNTVGMTNIPSPANSLLVYNTDSMCYFFYRLPSLTWVSLCHDNTGSNPSPSPSSADTIYANYVNVDSLIAQYIHSDTIYTNYANVDSLFANFINVDSLFANYANIDSLFANYIDVGTILTNYLDADTIIANYIQADSLIATYINADTVFAHFINADTIIANYILADSIFAHYIQSDSIVANYANFDSLFINGVPIFQAISDSIAAQAWLLNGNSNTNPALDFIGTSDAADLVVKSNGTERMRVLSGGKIGINTPTPTVSLQINATDAIGIPNGTTAQQPVGAPIGSVRFNTTTGVQEVFNGTCWQNSNTPPIGSTYIQWFNAANPNNIYPCTVWISTDISSGEFIRATGGLSNVAAPPLTGVVQNFATQDHAHSSTGSVSNSSALNTTSDGGHGHTGSGTTTSDGNHQHSQSGYNLVGSSGPIPWYNWANGNYSTNDPLTGVAGTHTHTYSFTTSTDGTHAHIVAAHAHTLSLSVGNMNSGASSAETRPTNVAVVFWRRTQ